MKLRTPISETMPTKSEWVDQQPEPKKLLDDRSKLFEEKRTIEYQQNRHISEANEWTEIADILESKSNQIAWDETIAEAADQIEETTGRSYDYWHESYQWKADKLKELALTECCKAVDRKKELESKQKEIDENWKAYEKSREKFEKEYDKLQQEKEGKTND